MVIGSLVSLCESAMLSAGWDPDWFPEGLCGIVIDTETRCMGSNFNDETADLVIVMVSGKVEAFFSEDLDIVGENNGQEV
ncbi:hypothetical protein CMI47_19040 [Candidatus Pacearchaeota archaeon]|nr:hypothetical protein [Candidatus Pacearchaeota archaeon]|tara:strand:+ start:106 stop:345 length:240 start_codon:yes stop_codon:yes gene_type:complete